MEFRRTSFATSQKEIIQICSVILPMSGLVTVGIIEGIDNIYNYGVSILNYIIITAAVLLTVTTVMVYGILDLDRKVVIQNNMISYYVRRPWGYRLIREASISDISGITEIKISKEIGGITRAISKQVTGRGVNTSGITDEYIYKVLYKSNKKVFLEDMKTNNMGLFTNDLGTVLVDYLKREYNVGMGKIPTDRYILTVIIKVVLTLAAIYYGMEIIYRINPNMW